MKALVARALAKRVVDGEVIGLGSGSTAELAIDQIGQRIVRDKIRVIGVPTSYRTALIASAAGIEVLSPLSNVAIDWAFDGADEVDPQFNMIKGRGAAHLTEKIVARRAKQLLIIVSEDKIVSKLGTHHPVPIEVIPEAVHYVEQELKALGAKEVTIRPATNKYGPIITEHNNLVVDASFSDITPALDLKIKQITGVVETGLFCNFNQELLVAKSDGVYLQRLKDGRIEEELIERP